jgi:hypothetical protein
LHAFGHRRLVCKVADFDPGPLGDTPCDLRLSVQLQGGPSRLAVDTGETDSGGWEEDGWVEVVSTGLRARLSCSHWGETGVEGWAAGGGDHPLHLAFVFIDAVGGESCSDVSSRRAFSGAKGPREKRGECWCRTWLHRLSQRPHRTHETAR